jgi:hypothetical protein
MDKGPSHPGPKPLEFYISSYCLTNRVIPICPYSNTVFMLVRLFGIGAGEGVVVPS